ncbi:hypothetical protein AMELA_G00184580 [Ameiurus melas]|uniref:Uncharacterized protein n=1 Tax=Ameiurus melas TaxID=219545 RepID=A0A7J6AAN9_AMEME|nr:hypothetical protein AMELA_G00184580 [Ameiurus melas]
MKKKCTSQKEKYRKKKRGIKPMEMFLRMRSHKETNESICESTLCSRVILKIRSK